MTSFTRAKEDRPTPKEIYNWKVYAFALILALGTFAYGYDTAFIGTTITQPSFVRDFGLNHMSKSEQNNVSSNVTSIYSAGGFFGALFVSFSLELLGRKSTVIISDAIFILGAILCTVAQNQLGLIYAGRLLSGLGVGGLAAVTPIYIAEISPPAIRGRLIGFIESSYQIGSVVGFWINYGIVHHIDPTKSMSWRIPMAVQMIPTGLMAIFVPLLKESPTWLVKRGREEQAVEVFSFLRNLPADHDYVAEDVAYIKGQIEHERALSTGGRADFTAYLRGAGKEALMRGIRNRFGLVFMLFVWQAWSGSSAINYYSPTIFTSIGLTDVTLWTGIYGIIKAVAAVIFFTWFLDRLGRKWPWIISCFACALCQYYLAAYIAVAKPKIGAAQSSSTVAGGKAATAAIMIFGAIWTAGANGMPWIISAEIFPSSLRSISGPWASMCVWLWTYVVTKSLPYMFTSMAGYGVYIFFASCLVCASIYAFFFLPETKGLRMDQMDEIFGFVSPGNDYAEYVKSEQ
ncbi:general substrate transporter [Viridothelium virens]|uniref:General substrate transporter n=1 Tax=Viridothelium virens TaxID=1048519 RepID=A0A6A6GZJ8_VIRVR|nr:general substrate transporter [Viridothelium virens]